MNLEHVALAVSSLLLSIQTEPFEGYIDLGPHRRAPIWMELQIPDSDGPVTGVYFYKKVGKEIPLKGQRKGNLLQMTESDGKGGVTGVFTGTRQSDSIVGTWKAPKDSTAKALTLYKATPDEKRLASMPKASELVLSDGKTLDSEMREYQEGSEGKKRRAAPLDTDLFRKGILSVNYGFDYMGAYPTSIVNFHTFDLAGPIKKELVLRDEIDPKQRKRLDDYLRRKIQAELTAHRKEYPDSEWFEVLGECIGKHPEDEDKALDRCFVLPKGPPVKGSYYYFTEEGLHYAIGDYFELPHATQAMDFACDIVLPFADLKKYLRKESALNRLTH